MTKRQRAAWVMTLLVFAAGTAVCQFGLAEVADEPAGKLEAPVPPQDEPGLVIENDSDLPDTHPQAPYEVRFRAHGNISTLRWRVEKGALPAGMKLDADGRLHGSAERS